MSQFQLDEEAIFDLARKIESHEARADYLDQACGTDKVLKDRIAELLQAHDAEQDFLERPPVELDQTIDAPRITEKPGDTIGPYKLLEKIGEGGFGVVYMAEQTRPVRRRVALKVIKPGMDSKEVTARFEAERQALAMMNHPNIAKVHDGGETQSGRPYFVMELVKGIPLTQFCDEQRLPTKERLQLFATVCGAIQHAHQKGVIHRDIKPANVMVTLHDGDPVPKVIDFGISKAINQQLTEKTMFTSYGQMVGTPQYMSPEQAEMSGLDVDTRSDIYSLGVLLYELLTGSTPLEAARIRTAGYAEMQRLIKEDIPPKPSTRVSEVSQRATAVAKQRGITPEALRRSLRGDLDWVVMKALDKDRNRRYETANGLAKDIQRHLNQEPVLASPPSAGYRFSKFVRRNRGLVVAASAITASLIIGLVASVVLYLQASESEDRAVASRIEAESQRAIAETNANDARRALADKDEALREAAAVSTFLFDDIMASADPAFEPDRQIQFRTVLDQAAQRIEGRFDDTPMVEAAIRYRLGQMYGNLRETASAEEMLRKAWEIRRDILGEKDPDTLQALETLVFAMRLFGKDSQELLEELFRLRLESCSENAPEVLRVRARLAQRVGYDVKGDGQEGAQAVQELKEILRQQRLQPATEHSDSLRTTRILTQLYLHQGRVEDAKSHSEEARRLHELHLGKDHPSTLFTIAQLGEAYLGQQRYNDAERILVDSLASHASVMGERSLITQWVRLKLANVRIGQRRTDDAIEMLETAVDSNQNALLSALLLGALYIRNSEHEKHRRLCERLVDTHHLTDSAQTAERVATVYFMAPFVERSPLFTRAAKLAKRSTTVGENELSFPWFALCHGMAEYRSENYQNAIELLRESSQRTNWETRRGRALAFLAMSQFRHGDVDGAKESLDEARQQIALLKPTFQSSGLHNKLNFQIALEEASTLIEGN